jgi:hypothetical protein
MYKQPKRLSGNWYDWVGLQLTKESGKTDAGLPSVSSTWYKEEKRKRNENLFLWILFFYFSYQQLYKSPDTKQKFALFPLTTCLLTIILCNCRLIRFATYPYEQRSISAHRSSVMLHKTDAYVTTPARSWVLKPRPACVFYVARLHFLKYCVNLRGEIT